MDGSLQTQLSLGAAVRLRPVGYVDRIEADIVSGWAWFPDDPDATVQVEVFIGTALVARLDADTYRKDLQAAGRGTGRYGFTLRGMNVLLGSGRELVAVRFADGGADLPGSPRWVQSADAGLDDSTVQFITAAVQGAARNAQAPAALDTALSLLTELLGTVAATRAGLREDGVTALDELAAQPDATGPVAALARDMRERFPPLPLPAVAESPRASVIIPAHGKFELTYACIAAIAEAGAAAPFEIVLVDDGSADETLLADFVFGGAVRVVRQRRNGGFLAAANAGAAAARGDYLLFLNNDTEVQEGWLDELLAAFDQHPDIGIAGAKLIYPDGTLQEAGGIVGRFGEATNWGNGLHPDEPRFCYLRDADYVSGAALMIPRALFAQLGGFDAEFAPGYYEDTDLCFRMREQLGRRVVMQPLSRIIHKEGGTAGTDTEAAGMKRSQLVNQRRFFRRWQQVLARHRPAGQDAALEAERHVARRAVFIDESVPTPDRDAGSCAAFAHMRLLQGLGYKVTFIPAHNMARIDPYTADLQRLGIECLHAPQLNSVEECFRRMAVKPDLVYLHRYGNAVKYSGLVREHFPEARLVYNVADLHFLRLRREAELTADAELLQQAERMEASELLAIQGADRVIVHSHVEAEMLARVAPRAQVHVVPWTIAGEAVAVPLAERRGTAFIGGYAHRPNLDAALQLAQSIMPQVWQQVPELPCLLVGSNMPQQLQALAGPGLEPLGHVPDLRAVFARLRCTVAPLRYGAGIKGKVLTSLAHGIPCVMSPIAAEGIAFPEALQWLVAGDDAAMAAKILALHADDALAARLSAAGLAFLQENFSEAAVQRLLAAAVAP